MFKGLSIFFETYSITTFESKNKELEPIDVPYIIDDCKAKVHKKLEELGFNDFVDDRNFKEIFAKTEKFEITVSFIGQPNGSTRIGVALFSPKHKRTKKKLIAILNEIRKEFSENELEGDLSWEK